MESESLSDYYLRPKDLIHNPVSGSEDSGIETWSGNGGTTNPSFLSSPESELETSFSHETNSLPTKPYLPPKSRQTMDSSGQGRTAASHLELNLPPPPGNLWMPAEPAPPETPQYVYPLSPDESLAKTGISAEEEQLILTLRKQKLMRAPSLPSPKSPKEDAGNLYEEVPQYAFVRRNTQQRESQRAMKNVLPDVPQPPPSRLTVNSETSHSEHSLYKPDSTASGFKKENPLYATNESTIQSQLPDADIMSNDELQYSHKYNKTRGHNSSKCYCAALVVVFIIASAALTLTILTATGTVNLIGTAELQEGSKGSTAAYVSNSSDLDALLLPLIDNMTELAATSRAQMNKIEELNSKISALQKKNNELEQSLNKSVLNLQNNEDSTTGRISSLNSSLINVDTRLNSVSEMAQNISKLPGPRGVEGPQGPTGFINTSLCSHDWERAFSLTATTSTPQVQDTVNSKIMAVSCNSDYYTTTSLEHGDVIYGKSYKCKCGGLRQDIPGGEDATCALNYWKCLYP